VIEFPSKYADIKSPPIGVVCCVQGIVKHSMGSYYAY